MKEVTIKDAVRESPNVGGNEFCVSISEPINSKPQLTDAWNADEKIHSTDFKIMENTDVSKNTKKTAGFIGEGVPFFAFLFSVLSPVYYIASVLNGTADAQTVLNFICAFGTAFIFTYSNRDKKNSYDTFTYCIFSIFAACGTCFLLNIPFILFEDTHVLVKIFCVVLDAVLSLTMATFPALLGSLCTKLFCS